MKQGLCRTVHPESMFVDAYYEQEVIDQVCTPCPVKNKCLEYALNYPDPLYGIWGGVPEVALARMRSKRGKTAGAAMRHQRRIPGFEDVA